jgi:hypothetical protein
VIEAHDEDVEATGSSHISLHLVVH